MPLLLTHLRAPAGLAFPPRNAQLPRRLTLSAIGRHCLLRISCDAPPSEEACRMAMSPHACCPWMTPRFVSSDGGMLTLGRVGTGVAVARFFGRADQARDARKKVGPTCAKSQMARTGHADAGGPDGDPQATAHQTERTRGEEHELSRSGRLRS